ncbi:uncharacterized protein TNCV_106221 [Trichonephila clavipes]|nr:uncharacterized protein TNCV_106221 [Trichonephila clavipes]
MAANVWGERIHLPSTNPVGEGEKYASALLSLRVVDPHTYLKLIRYQTDKLAGCVGDTETIRDHTGMQGRKCRSSTRGLLATDHVILNHGQVTWTTPELTSPLLTTPPHQREDVSGLGRFNVHRCPTRRVFSGTGLELVTKQATIRYLYHSATASLTLWKTHPCSHAVDDVEQKVS